MLISSAAILEDGRITAAAPEERFNRQKMSSAFPARALEFCLEIAGCDVTDLDLIVIPWNPGIHLRSASSRFTGTMRWRGEYLVTVPGSLLNFMDSPDVEGIELVLKLEHGDTRLSYINHHMAHAAGAFFASSFEEAAIFTVDGRGEHETTTLGVGRGNRIEKLDSVDVPHSLGLLYNSMTQFLGFRPDSDEWKVMALASYGKEDNPYVDKVRSLVRLLEGGGFELDPTYFAFYHFDRQPRFYTDKLIQLLGPERRKDDPLEEFHSDIARALQQVFEECAVHMLTHLHEQTGLDRLVMAGGAALNSVFNGKIQDLTPFREVFIPPCPDDSGVAVGAALYAHHCLMDEPRCEPHAHNYWGPKFSDDEIAGTLKGYKLRADRHDDIAAAVAELLVERKLVGWFQGRMEFGQRALGNRSILADPRDPEAKDRINSAVKFREGFRPFAPAVLEEKAGDWFELPDGAEVPFMERVFPIKEEKRDSVPAVVHCDGSSRLQTVSRATNARFHDLISGFEGLTGVPIVVNTSFNLNGEPIVCTPTDAIRTFYSCGLDILAIGDYIVRK